MLLTFVVVALSAWRVSRLNIVAAVRGLPEPVAPRGGAAPRSASARSGSLLGVALAWSGLSAAQATPFALGLSLAIVSLVPLARAAGVPERLAYHGGRRAAAGLVAAAVRHHERHRRARAEHGLLGLGRRAA